MLDRREACVMGIRLGGGIVGALVLVAACSSGETGHGSTASTSSSTAASSSSSSAVSTAPSSPGSSSALSSVASSSASSSAPSSSPPGAIPACGDTAFAVSNTPTDSATGHSTFVILFRNKLAHSCTVFGYPGLDAVSASGATLAHATRTLTGFAGGATSIRTITVAPGGTASARVEWTNFNTTTGGDCAVSDHVLVTPANTADTVSLAVSVTVCNLQVHPTVPGTSGNSG